MRAMKITQAPRASAILYNLLTSLPHAKPWLMPANICPIVPITFMKARVPFQLIDISARTLHMDLDQAGALIESREFGGLLYAHTYGDESTPEVFFQLAKTINSTLIIVDDRCLCIPGFERSTLADLVLYSTGYAKIVELEFGGYALINDAVKYRPARLAFDPASHVALETNYKTAVRTRSKFEYYDTNWLQTDADLPDWYIYGGQIEQKLEASLAHRRELNSIYASRLPGDIQLTEEYQTWRFNVRVVDKQGILKTIFERGLFASSHYASLAGIMTDNRAPVAEALANDVINLFNDYHFTPEMAHRVCDIVVDALGG